MVTRGDGAALHRTLSQTLGVLLMAAQLTVAQYQLVLVPSSWPEAQSFCRVKHSDLATVRHMDDQRRLLQALPAAASSSWIGLRGGDALRWRWSDGAGPAGFTAWREDEPNNVAGNEWCAETSGAGGWNDVPCGEAKSSVCLERRQDGQHRFVYDSQHRSFQAAQQQCRAAHTDLATISSATDNHDIAGLLGGNPDAKAWIGLFRDHFLWSSGSHNSFRFWLSGPRHTTGCAAAATAAPGRWLEAPCDDKKTFVCEGGLKVRTLVVRVELRTHAGVAESSLAAALLEKLESAMREAGATDFKLTWRRRGGGKPVEESTGEESTEEHQGD